MVWKQYDIVVSSLLNPRNKKKKKRKNKTVWVTLVVFWNSDRVRSLIFFVLKSSEAGSDNHTLSASNNALVAKKGCALFGDTNHRWAGTVWLQYKHGGCWLVHWRWWNFLLRYKILVPIWRGIFWYSVVPKKFGALNIKVQFPVLACPILWRRIITVLCI